MLQILKLIENLFKFDSLTPQLLVVIVELTWRDFEMLSSYLHQRLSCHRRWKTQYKVFNLFTWLIEFVAVIVVKSHELVNIFFSRVPEMRSTLSASRIQILLLLTE